MISLFILFKVATLMWLLCSFHMLNEQSNVWEISKIYNRLSGLPQWLSGKEPTCNAGDVGLIPRSGKSPGEGNGNPLQYSCLENPLDRGAWQATVHGVAKESNMTKLLNNNNFTPG